MRRFWRWCSTVVFVALAVPLALGPVAPAAAASASPLEVDIPNGRYFGQTGGSTGRGFDLRDYGEEAFGGAQFWTAVQQLGGVEVVGYPASRPFSRTDGCIYQLTQAVALQQCPGYGVRLANTFQILGAAGLDEQLYVWRNVPRPIEDDGSTSFEDAVRIRLGWLTNSDLQARFFAPPSADLAAGWSDADAINLYGLPMSLPEDFGPFISQRFQRVVFQLWTQEVPGMPAPGTVVAVLGGDLIKETQLVTGAAALPHEAGESLNFAAPVALGNWPEAPQTVVSRPAPTPQATAIPPTPQATPPATAVPQATATSAPALPALLPPTRGLQYGFQADLMRPDARAKAIALTREAGFGWLKQQVVWSQYEVAPGVYGEQQFRWLDDVVNDVSGAGLRLLLSVVKAPNFYAAPNSHTPQDPAKLKSFLQYLAARYRGKVQAYETWNEQNLAVEWGIGRLWPNGPRDFVQLQKNAYEGVKAGDPAAIVVFPALTPTGVGECDGCDRSFAIDDRVYLDLVYQVNNGEIKGYFDVLGVHPSGYNNPPGDWVDVKTVPSTGFKVHPSFYFKRFTQLRDVMLKYGDDKPLWFTEFGWDACNVVVPGYEYCRDNSEAQQAQYLTQAFGMVKSAYPYVTNMFVWNLNFQAIVPEPDEKWGFGVIRPDGSPRPAYTALKAMPK